MRATPLHLSAAFLDEDKRIINTVDLEPFDEYHHHQPIRPARYVLEVNRGWFRARRIEPGARAQFQLPQGMAIT